MRSKGKPLHIRFPVSIFDEVPLHLHRGQVLHELLVDFQVNVHTGLSDFKHTVSESMVGFKAGAFSFTKKLCRKKQKNKKKGSNRKVKK